MRSAMDLFDFEKSANLKHPSVELLVQLMKKPYLSTIIIIMKGVFLFC